ncbi:MAG TPA: SagB/ThcOx family dehydrogenase [Candidatus Acidoferrum sp.]|nr:SagB/ThcOx family dehydrogenase [Candidatus Acidoferrum sp.]
MRKQGLVWILAAILATAVGAQELKPMILPAPQTDGGRPLMQALKERKSTREFSAEKLPVQVLANLLWAGFGVNRPDGRRTAPSAMNWQEIGIYVVTADGTYVYDAAKNRLEPVTKEDLRSLAGTQSYAATAPVNLVYVADMTKAGDTEGKEVLTGADTGFIAQNVYLYCASEGLATVVRASVDSDALGKALKLKATQKIVLAQSVGYPKK